MGFVTFGVAELTDEEKDSIKDLNLPDALRLGTKSDEARRLRLTAEASSESSGKPRNANGTIDLSHATSKIGKTMAEIISFFGRRHHCTILLFFGEAINVDWAWYIHHYIPPHRVLQV